MKNTSNCYNKHLDLSKRIKIGKYVFILETQVARNTWDEKNPNEKLIPSIYVLNVLTKNIDEILRTMNVPVSPSKIMLT